MSLTNRLPQLNTWGADKHFIISQSLFIRVEIIYLNASEGDCLASLHARKVLKGNRLGTDADLNIKNCTILLMSNKKTI